MIVKIRAKDGYKTVDLNRRKAIHERCLNCSCWTPSEVRDCSFSECPLHAFRSGRGKQNPKTRAKAIRKFCLWCMAGQQSEIRKCVSLNCPLFPYRKKGIDQPVEIVSEVKSAYMEPISEAENGVGI